MWDAGQVKTAAKFERMLLVGCKGMAAAEAEPGPLLG